jgi:putative membrane protein
MSSEERPGPHEPPPAGERSERREPAPEDDLSAQREPPPAGELSQPRRPASADALSEPQHLHSAEVVLAALENLREIGLAALVALVVGGGAGMSPLFALLVGLGGVAVSAIAGYVRWRGTTFWIAGQALHFRRGVLSPDETSVPLGRIQAIDATQGPIQRLFGVQELHVQTAGGGAEGEIVLRAVSDSMAARLRAAVGLPDPTTRDLPEWRLGPGRLLVAAVTAPQLGVILPLVGGVAAVGDDVFFDAGGEQLFDRLPDDRAGIVLVAGAVAGVALLLSVLGAIVAFAGFSLVRDGERLRIRRGLLARRAASVPLARVHAVDVVEGVLRRPFGMASVRMETAGYRSEPAAAQTLLPLVHLRDVERLLAEFVPVLAAPTAPLEPPPARARRRYALPPALAGALVGAGVAVAVPAAWPAVPALAALGAADGLLRHRSAGWREDRGRLVVRGRVLARRTLLARVDRLQHHGLRASPVQRSASLADFEAAVGSGRSGRVRHLEAAVAGALFERLRPRGASNR